MKKFIVICLLLLSCTPSSYDGFYREGESLAYAVAKDLEKVETLEDLKQIEGRLKKKFDKLTDLMIAVERFNQGMVGQVTTGRNTFASDKLKFQMERIYAMEGGKEAFEAIAQESLQKIQLNLR